MSLLTASSMESRWRGYEYYKGKKVFHLEHPENMRFHAVVSVRGKESCTVTIGLEHLRHSSCTCPHTAGRQAICKHMVAVFFAAFPEEAEKYYTEVLKAEEEWEAHQDELANKLVKWEKYPICFSEAKPCISPRRIRCQCIFCSSVSRQTTRARISSSAVMAASSKPHRCRRASA